MQILARLRAASTGAAALSQRLLAGGTLVLALGSPGQAQAGAPGAEPQQGPPAQTPGPQPPSDLPPGRQVEDPRLWSMLDETVAVVGDEIITLRDLQSSFADPAIQARRQEFAKLPPEERQQAESALQTEILADLIERLLRTRAGEDRGFDPGLVAQLVEDRVSRIRKNRGGPAQYREWLTSFNFDPESFRQLTERNLYQQAWEGSVMGIQPGPTGRFDRDTYVRPGQLYATYKRLATSPRPEERAIVGFQQGEVEIAEMALSFQANGGEQATADLVNTLRSRILAGDEDFDTVAAEFGQTGKAKYITTNLEAIRTASLKTFGHERLHAFAESASPGEISPPLLSKLGGLNLYLLVSRIPARPVAPFATLETQNAVEAWIEKQRNLVRLGRGTADLLRRVSIQPEAMARYMARPAWLYREDNGGQ